MTADSIEIKYSPDNDLIIIKLRKGFGLLPFIDSFPELVALSNKNKCKKILINGTDLEALPSLSEIYKIVKFELQYSDWFSNVRRAYILSDKIKSSFSKYSGILLNNGLKSQKLKTIEEAILWFQT